MPIWTDIRHEIDDYRRTHSGARDAQDVVRRSKLQALEAAVGHPVVVYAADFTNQAKPRDVELSITSNDKDGWVEVTSNLPSGPLDLLIHSPGGSPFVAEWVVNFLRARFNPIRVIVPHSAKSAATMLAMAADAILMDEVGELGPIDPQMTLMRDQQLVTSPAQAIKDQFATAQTEIQGKPQSLAAWIPILRQFGPSLLTECDNAIDLAQALVQTWLQKYMFAGKPDADQLSAEISAWLGNHNNFKAHARRIGIDELLEHKVKVMDLRTNDSVKDLRDPIWAAWSAVRITFDTTGAYKMFENSRGEAFIKTVQIQQQVIMPGGNPIAVPSPGLPSGVPTTPPTQGGSRAQRRGQQLGRR